MGRHARAALRRGRVGRRARLAVRGRGRRASLSTWLPWLLYDDRPIFSSTRSPSCRSWSSALTLALGSIVGPLRRADPRGVRPASVVAGSFVVLALLNFAWFWPIWTDQLLTHPEWLRRIWFTRWI